MKDSKSDQSVKFLNTPNNLLSFFCVLLFVSNPNGYFYLPMKIIYSLSFVCLLFIAVPQSLAGNSALSNSLQLPGQFYMVLYVESNETEKIQAFIAELESLPNKIISVTHNNSTHEFTIIFTELIRSDTIYQILLRYFEDFKEVDGYYLN